MLNDGKQSERRDAFIVRIWREDGRPGWKAWVQHVPTGEAVLVRRLDKLLAFIERWTGKLTDAAQKGLQ